MSDHIAIRGIRVMGRHGVHRSEREQPQPFDVDVVLEVDVERSAHTDDLADSVDYARVHEMVVQIVSRESYALLERLAQELARQILHHEHVHGVTITVAKPGVLSGATPSVTLRRKR